MHKSYELESIKKEADYNKAAIRMMDAESGTPESDELDLLIVLIKDYNDRHYHLPELDGLEVIKYKMVEMGMKAKDLEPIIGSKGHIAKPMLCASFFSFISIFALFAKVMENEPV